MSERWTNHTMRIGGLPRFLVLSLLAVAAWFWAAGPATADTILAINPVPAPGHFHTNVDLVQTSPYSFVQLSTVPGVLLTGLAIRPDNGKVYASSGQMGLDPGTLFVLDPSTGAVSPRPNATGSQGVTALAFGPDGTLYGAGGTAGTGGPGTELITINPKTGVGMAFPNTFGLTGNDAIASLAFGAGGVLFGGDTNGDNIYSIATSGPNAGVATFAGALSGTPPGYTVITGLAGDSQGNVFASLANPGGPHPGVIGEVNTQTGAFTELGTLPGQVSDIAVIVPEPGTLALLGLGVVGLLGYRRRFARWTC